MARPEFLGAGFLFVGEEMVKTALPVRAGRETIGKHLTTGSIDGVKRGREAGMALPWGAV
jgi:hypothetical protein